MIAVRRAGAVIALLALVAAAPAHAELTGAPLKMAVPAAVDLAPRPGQAPIRLRSGARDWHGRLSHLAGSSHYDGGEWVYEDFPWTAYGAAPIGVAQAQHLLAALGDALPQARRLPGGLAEVQATTGAGPLVDEADVSELRVAVRGSRLNVLARTTTMRHPARTALLLLFDTGRDKATRDVPFGSGLRTARADVAALVTASGARVVDLASGATSAAPAMADPAGYENSLATRLPLSRLVASGGSSLQLVAAAGLAAPGSFRLEASGLAGPLAKVVPRTEPADQAVHERAQALALAAHDIDPFFTTISLTRLRRGDRERLHPGIGYSVATMTTPEPLSEEGGTGGTLRDYGLYVPRSFDGRPSPATMLLRGSGMTAHSLPAISPGLVRQLGDDNHAIVVSPGGRSGFDYFEGAAYLDALQALRDARRRLPIDPDRVSVAGYSMGGFATYMFAATQPDLFAGAFVIEGPVGGIQPATANTIVFSFPNVIPSLANLLHTPIAIYQGAADADVPITNALAAAERLRALGLRYQLNVFPGDHFTPGIFDDYAIGARYLRGARRVARPAEVRFTRDMTLEHAIDTGEHSDAPLAGHSVGLRFDHAWYVHDLRPVDPRSGRATIDVHTLARQGLAATPVITAGLDHGGERGGAPPSLYTEQHWRLRPARATSRNAFEATLTAAAHVALDLPAMGLTTARPLRGALETNAPATVELRFGRRGCIRTSVDGRPAGAIRRRSAATLSLAPGEHRVVLRRAPERACATDGPRSHATRSRRSLPRPA